MSSSAVYGVVGDNDEMQNKLADKEEQLQKTQEKLNEMVEMQDTLLDQLAEMRFDCEDRVKAATEREMRLSKENELLLSKIANMTLSHEMSDFDSKQRQLHVASLTADNKKLTSQLQAEKDSADRRHFVTAQMQQWIQQGLHLQAELQQSMRCTERACRIERHAELEKQVSDLTMALEQERSARSSTKIETSQCALLEAKVREAEQQLSQSEERSSGHGAPQQQLADLQSKSAEERKMLQSELVVIADKSQRTHSEFEALRTSLQRDLQNRCERVIDLEMALDDVREQLNQERKGTSTKTMRKKIKDLERNLEQLGAANQQLIGANNQLCRENQLAEKKLVQYKDRIHTLELLLQDATDKLWRTTSSHQQEMARMMATLERQSQAATSQPRTSIPRPANFLPRNSFAAPAILQPRTNSIPKPATPPLGPQPPSARHSTGFFDRIVNAFASRPPPTPQLQARQQPTPPAAASPGTIASLPTQISREGAMPADRA
eukprot:TRINITY_DN3445_c0_g1_i1.p1 TRINITY_DN3445_c0_g1~~TRINITY_DN3445_c0_g1_i1.p1  ORF type:complete len:493 (+),score=108.15 TRINITY_DN3445_c0_g1_i1:80-1558(+)